MSMIEEIRRRRAAGADRAGAQLRAALDRLQAMIDAGDADAARALLQELVVEFEPSSEVVDFVALRREETMLAAGPLVDASARTVAIEAH